MNDFALHMLERNVIEPNFLLKCIVVTDNCRLVEKMLFSELDANPDEIPDEETL